MVDAAANRSWVIYSILASAVFKGNEYRFFFRPSVPGFPPGAFVEASSLLSQSSSPLAGELWVLGSRRFPGL